MHRECLLKGNRCKGLKATLALPARGIFDKALEERRPEMSIQWYLGIVWQDHHWVAEVTEEWRGPRVLQGQEKGVRRGSPPPPPPAAGPTPTN